MTRFRSCLPFVALALALATSSSAVEWTSIHRSALGFVTVSSPSDFETDIDQETIAVDGPLSASIAVDAEIDGVAGVAQSHQESTIFADRIVGSGGVDNTANVTDPDGFADVFGQSVINVNFTLDEPAPYQLTGFIHRGADATARLFLLHDSTFLVDAAPAADQTIPVNESGTLQPGAYIVSVNISGYTQEAEDLHRLVFGEWEIDFRLGGATAAPILAGDGAMNVFPNPTKGATTIALAPGRATGSRIVVHDVSGRLVRTIDGSSATADAIRWDTRDAAGRAVPAGVYFLTVHGADSRQSHRVTVIR